MPEPRRWWRRAAGPDRGQALVELAIALPILLALVVGLYEFARLWSIQQVITNAAREGARAAVLSNGSATTARAALDAELASGNLDPARVTVYLGLRQIPSTPDTVRVTYDYQYQLVAGVVRLISGGAWSGTVQLRSEAVMQNQ